MFRNLICLSETQRSTLMDIGISPEKIVLAYNWVDERFFRSDFSPAPSKVENEDYVFSCGMENRDYATLSVAAQSLPYLFRVVASGWSSDVGFAPAEVAPTARLKVERQLSYTDLRLRYRDARFVVVPLNPVSYAAGVTGIIEAMAMSKAVIWSASPGIADYVQHNVSGLAVPPHDPIALAAAINELWQDPERCTEIGRRNREWVEKNLSMDKYVAKVCSLMQGKADEKRSVV